MTYFDLSVSLKVKCDGGIRLVICGFQLIYVSNHVSISHRFGAYNNTNYFSYLLSLSKNFKQEAQGLVALLDKMEDNDRIELDNIEI